MKYTPSDQPAKSFHVPAGDYDVTIVDAAETVSRTSGAGMIKLTLEVDTADGYAGSSVKVFDYLVATPSSAWKIDAFRRALGHEIVKDESVELAAEELLGRTLRARLKVDEFNGQLNNKVDAWLAPVPTTTSVRAGTVTQKELSENEPF